ncbi:MAG: hypothetical protein ACRC68_05565 [Clostridium sp.]
MDDKLYDFNKEQIGNYLKIVFECLNKGKFTIAKQGNRVKNNRFMLRNNINDAKAKEIINSLEVYDFCYAMRNDNLDPKFIDEVLYLFCKQIEHNVRGTLKELSIYIKINIIEPDKFMFVVSFHEFDANRYSEFPYLFKK